jgi:hypothetical protein
MIVTPASADRTGEVDDLFPASATLDEVDHREAINDDEVTADRGARAREDLERQPHAVRPAAAPAVGTAIGPRDQELVDEIPFRAHHLDAVVTRLARERGAAHESGYLALDAAVAELARGERRDRGLEARWRDRERMVGVAAGVQDLHADAAALGVHRIGHESMARNVAAFRSACRQRAWSSRQRSARCRR